MMFVAAAEDDRFALALPGAADIGNLGLRCRRRGCERYEHDDPGKLGHGRPHLRDVRSRPRWIETVSSKACARQGAQTALAQQSGKSRMRVENGRGMSSIADSESTGCPLSRA